MRVFKTQAIILKRKDIGEADRILTVFTKETGKIQIKAVGVRKIPSKRASHIELLNISELTLYKGKSLPILTEATTVEDFSEVKEDLKKVGCAYHVCELVESLCPEYQENNQVFHLLKETLGKIAQTSGKIGGIIREFEISLLTLLGYWSPEQVSQNLNVTYVIENILERKLKARHILPQLV